MRLVALVDGIFLSFFTKISHWFQRLTGRTNFFLAKMFFIFIAIVCAMDVVNSLYPFFIPVIIEIKPLTLTFLLYMTYCYYRHADNANKADESAINGDGALKRATFSSKNALMVITRLFVAILAVFSLYGPFYDAGWMAKFRSPISFFHDCAIIFVFLALYFSAVIPMPPGKSKVAEWAEAFGAYFKKLAISNSTGS